MMGWLLTLLLAAPRPLTVPTPIEHPERLARFAAAAARSGEQRVRVTHLGDSHVAADLYTATAREALQARFGDGGRGYVRPGRPWASHFPQHVRLTTTGRWRADGLRGGLADGGFGVGGCAMAAADPLVSVSVTVPEEGPGAVASQVDVHVLRQPHGGCLEVRVDGQPVGRVNTRGPWIAADFTAFPLPAGARTVSLHPGGGGEVRALGLSLTQSTGLVYDAIGINGAVATRLLTGRAQVFQQELARLAPDLVVLAYGTNEIYGVKALDVEAYRVGLDRTLDRVMGGAPDAACVLIGPPDFQRKKRTVPAIADVIEVQRQLADKVGCAFWDAQAAMGGPSSIARWRRAGRAQADRVHLTRDGYTALGTAWADALIEALDQAAPAGR